jgi:hypothetical protein
MNSEFRIAAEETGYRLSEDELASMAKKLGITTKALIAGLASGEIKLTAYIEDSTKAMGTIPNDVILKDHVERA